MRRAPVRRLERHQLPPFPQLRAAGKLVYCFFLEHKPRLTKHRGHVAQHLFRRYVVDSALEDIVHNAHDRVRVVARLHAVARPAIQQFECKLYINNCLDAKICFKQRVRACADARGLGHSNGRRRRTRTTWCRHIQRRCKNED